LPRRPKVRRIIGYRGRTEQRWSWVDATRPAEGRPRIRWSLPALALLLILAHLGQAFR